MTCLRVSYEISHTTPRLNGQRPRAFRISAEEVMFSSASVGLLAGLCKTYPTDVHKVRLKGGDFGGNPDHITLRLALGLLSSFNVTHTLCYG